MSSCYQEGQSHPSDMSGSLSPAPNTVLSLFILHAPCQHQVMFSIFFRQICLALMGGRAPLPSRNALLFIFSSTKKASTVIGTGFQAGDPREIRTPDTLIRSQVLYPAELLGHIWQGQRDSNPQPTVLETVALSIALCPCVSGFLNHMT